MPTKQPFIPDKQTKSLLQIFGGIILASIFAGLVTEAYFLFGIPALLLLVYLTVIDFKKVFFLLIISIPISMEVYLPNGLGTDLPIEPLIVGLMLIYIVYLVANPTKTNGNFIRHPITLLLIAHFTWTIIATLFSEMFVISMKFSLAKFWYIVVFYFLAGRMLKTEKDIRIFFWCILIPMLVTVLSFFVQHYQYDFSFEKVNGAVDPFYRNHVNFAAILAVFFPVVWFVRLWYPKGSNIRRFLTVALVVLLLAINFSFTRAAYVAIIIAGAAYFVVQWRLMKPTLILSTVVLLGLAYFLSQNNKYLDFAPDFEKAVTHTQFDNLLEATYKMEDVSTVERFYRWIAGGYMVRHNPMTGVGPGNFYSFYKDYTVSSYVTYVSGNPEKSGIHNYFLMLLVEQGIFGLLFYVILSFYVLFKGETVYHQTTNIKHKHILMFSMLSLIVVHALCLINDLIETDKVGSFFFMFMALIVNIDLVNKQQLQKEATTDS